MDIKPMSFFNTEIENKTKYVSKMETVITLPLRFFAFEDPFDIKYNISLNGYSSTEAIIKLKVVCNSNPKFKAHLLSILRVEEWNTKELNLVQADIELFKSYRTLASSEHYNILEHISRMKSSNDELSDDQVSAILKALAFVKLIFPESIG